MKAADKKIYLASKSPRRRELLRQVGIDFEVLALRESRDSVPEFTETVLDGETAADYVARITREKAELGHESMVWRRLPARPVLAADTTVSIDGLILGKPIDRDDAIDMLTRLAGRSHDVLTSVVVKTTDAQFQITQTSRVRFADLTPEQIAAYCSTGEPYDKAGGYAVQGLAAAFIVDIQGSYSGIMGLPLYETAQLLQQAGIKVL